MHLAGAVILCAVVLQAAGRPQYPSTDEMLAELEKFAQGEDPLDQFFASEDDNDMTAIFNGMESTFAEDLFETEARRSRAFEDYSIPPQIVDYSLLLGNSMTSVPVLNYVNNPNNPAGNALNGFPLN